MKLRNLIAGACALCCGIAAAAPLTKYTVTRPETVRVQNAVSLQSAERMLLGTGKFLAAAYPENIIHTITFNISDPQSAAVDEPFTVEVQEEQDVSVGIALPESYDYLGCAITTGGQSYDIERDLDALHEMGVFPDLANHVIRFLFVTRDFEVGLVCNLPKYVDAKNGVDDGNTTGSYTNPVRTITRALDLLGYQKGTVNVNPGVYAPVVIEQDVEIRIIAHGRVSECVIDGGGTNRCAQLGKALGDVKAKIVGFTLRNGDAGDQHGGGVRFGQVERCRVIDCRTKGDGGGLYGVAARDTLVALCSAGGQGNLADKSTLRNCTLRDSSSAGWALTTSGCRNCVVTSEGGATLLSGVDTFDHSVSNAVYACPGDRYSGYLAENSPGLAAGDVDVTIDGETDLDGKPRLTQGDYAATVDCGCYEGVPVLCTVHGDIKGVNPWGTSDFTMVEGSDLILPYGYSVIELSVGGEPVPQPPGGGTVIITNVQNSTTFSAYIVASRYADAANGDDRNDGYTPETAKKTLQAAIDCAPEAIEDPMYSRVFAAPGEYDMIETHDRKLTVEGIGGAGRVTLVGRVIERGTFGDGFHIPSIYPTIVAKLCKDDQVTHSYPPGVYVFILMPKRFIGEGVNTVLSGFTIERRATDEEIGSSTSTAADAMVVGGTLVACVIKNTSAAFPAARNTVMRNTLVTYGADFGGAGGTGCSYANCTIVPSGTATANALTASNAVRLANCVLSGRYTMNAEVGDRDPVATVTNGVAFVDAAHGDWHLAEGSAGLAAGDLAYVVDKTDLDGRLRTTMNGGVETVDCGCYETEVRQPWPICKVTGSFTGVNPFGTNEFDIVFGGEGAVLPSGCKVDSLTVDGKPVDEQNLPSAGEPLVRNAHEGMKFTAHIVSARYADAANGNDAYDGCTPATAKKTLQKAIDVAPTSATDADLSRVYAAPGIYAPIATSDRRLTIIGTAGAKKTIIDGGGTNRCADLGGAGVSGKTNTVLRGFTVRNGSAGRDGGGGVLGGTVIACIVTDNTAEDYGGGVSLSVVRNSLLARNVNTFPGFAFGGAGYSGSYYNCTIVSNSAPKGVEDDTSAAGIFRADALVNCVVQGNYGENGVEMNYQKGRFGAEPIATVMSGAVFVDAEGGDYRLRSSSAGIAQGEVAYVMDETDLDGKARTTTKDGVTTVNCGCYETLGPDNVRYVDAAKGNDVYDGLTAAKPMKTIQKAINNIPDGTTSADSVIYVAPGTYAPIVSANRKLTIVGTAGAKDTIIDGGGTKRCADLNNGAVANYMTNTVVRGFTIRNGYAEGEGGGVLCGTVIDCIITNNKADFAASGVARVEARNCLIAGNRMTASVEFESAVRGGHFWNCTFADNCRTNGTTCRTFFDGFSLYNCLMDCVVNADKVWYWNNTVTNGAVFADAANGDYHLVEGSAGIAEGDLAYVMDETDLDGVARTTTKGGVTTVNCGCYETVVSLPPAPESYTVRGVFYGYNPWGTDEIAVARGGSLIVPERTVVLSLAVDGKPVSPLPQAGEPIVSDVTSDKAVVAKLARVTYADALFGRDENDGSNPRLAKKTLQAAIDTALDLGEGTVERADDNLVIVAPGTYAPIATANEKLSIIGTEGAKETVIDGGQTNRCADLGGADAEGCTNAVLRGFTVRNGTDGICGGTVVRCAIVGNAVGAAHATLRNVLVAGNDAAGRGGRYVNCTFADNGVALTDVLGFANGVLTDAGYAGAEPVATVTSGAVFADPANGDYHLTPGSAGIAAGDLAYVTAGETDLDDVARTTTKDGKTTVNCGCYETVSSNAIIVLTYTGYDPYGVKRFTAVAGQGPLVPRGSEVLELSVDGTPVVGVLPQVGEPLVTGVKALTTVTVKFCAVRYADAANGDDANDGLSPDRAKQTLQAAIDVAPKSATDADLSRVYAALGTYAPIVTANEKLSIIGTEGAKATVIDGGQTNRCADLGGADAEGRTNAVLRGFTVRNGTDGIRGGTVTHCAIISNAVGAAHATLRNALVAGNVAAGRGGRYVSCTFADNGAALADVLGFANGVLTDAGYTGAEPVATVTSGVVFADAANGDYHLALGSEGFAAGDLAYVMDETDLDGKARTTTKDGVTTVNCGCYETTPSPVRITLTYTGVDPYGTNEFLSTGWGPLVPRGSEVLELEVEGTPVMALPQVGEPLVRGITHDSAVTVKFAVTRYADVANGDDANDGHSPDRAKQTLQAAIDVAPKSATGADLSRVYAAPGTYAPIVTANEKLSIIGTEGAKATVIDGGQTNRCADFGGADAEGCTNAVLCGFTVRNGTDGIRGGTVTHCAIVGNAVGAAHATLRNALVAGNDAAGRGGRYVNCTFVDNGSALTDVLGFANGVLTDAGYTGAEPVATVTNGVVFADAVNGDYHLKPDSAGVAAGDLAYVMDETDLDGKARTTTKGGVTTVNCGCYETKGAFKLTMTYTGIDPYGTNMFEVTDYAGNGPLVPRGSAVVELAVDGVKIDVLPQVGEPLVTNVTHDSAVTVKFATARYADAANGDDANDGLSPDRAKRTLQAAIDVVPASATDADLSRVYAAPGVYGRISTENARKTIVGTEGAARTVIDGEGGGRCAYLGDSSEAVNTVLRGFTVRNGKLLDYMHGAPGVGVLGGTVEQCVIAGNVGQDYGAGVAYSTVRDSLIVSNVLYAGYCGQGGGTEANGAAAFSGRFFNCTIVDNTIVDKKYDGRWPQFTTAGLYWPQEVVNCVVQDNLDMIGQPCNIYASKKTVATVTSGVVFADAAHGDYHLLKGSAGIAAGDLAYVMDETDLDGEARTTTRGGKTTVNCGCYETVVGEEPEYVTIEDGGETYQIPYVWLEGYGLVPAGADYDTHYAAAVADSANPVGPGAAATLPAWKSYVAGLDPTNGVEMFYSVIEAPSNGWFRVGPNEIRHNREYTVVERGVLSEERGGKSEEGGVWSEEGGVKVWPIPDGETGVDVEDNGTNSFFRVNVRVK